MHLFHPKAHTLRRRLVLPILAILIVQGLLYFFVFMQGNVLSRMDENAYEILNERTINRKLYLEKEMVHRWSNMTESETAVLDKIANTLRREGRSYADIGTDAALNQAVVQDAAQQIIYLLRRNLVSGAFLILDGPGLASDTDGSTRAGFYIRDLDPTSYVDDNGDLLLERGMPTISKSMQISLDSYWSSAFTFRNDGSPDERYFFEPLNAARASDNNEAQNFGYWCPGYSLNEDNLRAISYSIPLIAPDGTVFGVMGVEINQPYIQDMLNFSELNGSQRSAYVLGVLDEEAGTISPVLSSGPFYSTQFYDTDTLTFSPASGSAYTLDPRAKTSEKLSMALAPFQLYNTNTPFAQQEWVLAGVVAQNDLLAFSSQIRSNAALSVLLCFLFSICALFVAGRQITHPLIALVNDLEKSDPNKPIALRKLHIDEIDRLSGAIEQLSGAVAESSSRFSKILLMTGVQLAVFEYSDNSPTVFCSDNIYSLLGWPPPAEPGASLPASEFLQRMQELEQHRYAEDDTVYLLEFPTGPHWVKVIWLHEGSRHLGAVSDITHEVLEKQKVEYERDYDTLTHLYNRRAFDRQLDQLFRKPETLGVSALLMWDLDNLKYINDTYGHDCGDLYIKNFAKAIDLEDPAHVIAARRSGDEFYIFIHGYASKEEARRQIDRIAQHVTGGSFVLPNGSVFRLRASGGVAWYPDDALTYPDLIRYADFAMYTIKHSDKGRLQEFDRAAYQENSILIGGQEALNRLIDSQLVRFALQPILEVRTGSVYGYELLMRSLVPEFNSPQDILRLAHAQSKLSKIERMTYFKALETFSRLDREGQFKGHERAFINSIASQCMSEEEEAAFAAQYGSYLPRMVMEVTENEPYEHTFTAHKIEATKRTGGLVALDDFGTGYNSERLLIDLAPDIVKVDISIIHGIDQDADRQSLLNHLISYAHDRGILVLAEGVETLREMEYVVTQGVDLLQGYFIARPTFDIEPIAPQILAVVREAYEKRKP